MQGKPEIANIHQQHVVTRVNGIPTSFSGKDTQRRQVAHCFRESIRIRTHSVMLTVVLKRQHVRPGGMKCLSLRKRAPRVSVWVVKAVLWGVHVSYLSHPWLCLPITCSAAITHINQWSTPHLNHTAAERPLMGTHSVAIWRVIYGANVCVYPSIHSFSVIWHLFLIGGAFSRCEAGIQHGQVTSPSANMLDELPHLQLLSFIT